MKAVRHWFTRNDANHNNRHAECDGIEFFGFPYQPYCANLNWGCAVVSDFLTSGKCGVIRKWSVRFGPVKANGYNTWTEHRHFGDPQELRDANDEERDNAFRWATELLKQSRTGPSQ